jgi:hypothetical protein
MKVELTKNVCVVTTDGLSKERFYTDSTLLHHIKKALIAQGHDVIKKRMWRDGHMVDDTQQYIRARDGSWCVYDEHYQTRQICKDLDLKGIVHLRRINLGPDDEFAALVQRSFSRKRRTLEEKANFLVGPQDSPPKATTSRGIRIARQRMGSYVKTL